MRVLIAAGGTGGHIYPGVSLANDLVKQGAEILFVGTSRGLESDVVPKAGYTLRTISARYIPRKVSLKVLQAILVAAKGTWEARSIIKSFHPDVVVGTGGYVSGPVLLMAASMRYRTLIHEQNAYPGITNRLLARLVSRIAVGYAEAAQYFPAAKTVVTGNPVRPEVLQSKRVEGVRAFGLDPRKRTLLVTGGSQGARSLNRAILQAAERFNARSDLQVLHAAGKAHYPALKAELAAKGGKDIIEDTQHGYITYGNIRIMPYIYTLPAAMAAADLVVGRGGALSSAEITVRGLPAILVPYPFSAEDHQVANARVLERHGAAKVILDKDVNGDTLSSAVFELLDHPAELAAMAAASRKLGKPQAGEALLQQVLELAR